jgi:hypothetical protein
MATDPEARVLLQALPDFVRSSGSGTGSTQPREYNWEATWKKAKNIAVGIRHADHVTLCIRKKLALTSPTSGGRLSSIFRSRTKATV